MESKKKLLNILIPVAVGVVMLIVGYFLPHEWIDSIFQSKNVAVINGEKITVQEFEAYAKFYRIQSASTYEQLTYYANMYEQYGMSIPADWSEQIANIEAEFSDPELMGQAVLDLLTENKIIETEGKKLGISVSEDEIAKLMYDSFGYYPEGTPTSMPTATEYAYPTYSAEQLAMWATPTTAPMNTPTIDPAAGVTEEPALEPTATAQSEPAATQAPTEAAPTATPVSEESYLASMQEYLDTLTPYGLSEADLQQLVYYNLFYNKVYDEITKDVETVAEQVWARQILLASEEEANQVVADLQAGQNWWVETYNYTLDSNGQNSGGDLGWFPRGIYSEEITNAAFEMQMGETRIVQDTDGWHVLQVTGHEAGRPIDSSMLERLKSVLFNDWLDEAKTNAKVKINDIWKDYVPTEPALPAGN